MNSLILLIISILFSYFLMAVIVIWYEFEIPPFMPFFIFKSICSIGTPKPISEFPQIFNGRSVADLTSEDWRKWGQEIIEKQEITKTAALCFNRRFITEIDKILSERE